MKDNSRLPIALRRTPRRQSGLTNDARPSPPSPSFPGRRQSPASKVQSQTTTTRHKRKRDAQPIVVVRLDDEANTTPQSRAIAPAKRRKYSSKSCSGITQHTDNEIHIFPLRAILDDRVKRRIRRNGLSEEMNTIFQERTQRRRRTVEELQRLRDELAAKENENESLRERSSLLLEEDTSRIEGLEREISGLREALRGTSQHRSRHGFAGWDMRAADAFSDDDENSFLDSGDHLGEDTTLEGSECFSSSPPAFKAKAFVAAGPTLTPPSTSPTKTFSPAFDQSHTLLSSVCEAGTQACFEDPEKEELLAETESLRTDLANIRETLEAQQQLESDLRSKLSRAEASELEGGCDPDLQLQMDIMLQNLTDKSAELVDLKTSLASITGPDSDAREAVRKLTEAMHSAQLEVEQLFPGDDPAVLSVQGTQVFDLVLGRLRDAAGKLKEYQTELECCHEVEHDLRQQLNDSTQAMSDMTSQLDSKNEHISGLVADVDRLNHAVEDYRTQLTDLESLVQQMDTETKGAQARFEFEIETGKQTIARRDGQLARLEARLSSALHNTSELKDQLAVSYEAREAEIAAVQAAHEDELALRDVKAAKLHKEITLLREALSRAHGTISQLRAEKGHLQAEVDHGKESAREAVACLRAQLLGALRMSEAFLCPPAPTHRPEKEGGTAAGVMVAGIEKEEDEGQACMVSTPKSMT
ncbi:hypothetical protein M406DRAFT_348845 [Cryphonectria parasitica EP155]|uniref:Uncharacterized protein n=1 Tax=Cryphonectria parasitica (strain ATCC 38755 / EP155) TaxID=660469 RepID=A0A9P4YA15_CRYP1|nr:uncharacterized protein M406DRAFT_348845 [Cryphonectria parasitica EP155]KAF3769702.1 hypothetical protein M406DRAFT_348845 [Cryphonectria parasitica EP155]